MTAETSTPRWYTGHGIRFRSALDLPELSPTAPPDDDCAPDAEILLGPEANDALSKRLGDAWVSGFVMTADGPVLDIKDNAAILVRDGREIILSIADDADIGLVRLYLIGSAIGMLFHQRGHLILHGAAIQTPRGVSVFVGDSGAGKSTLAAHLGQAGHAILSDDTLVLWPTEDGFCAWPGSRVFKLWRNTLAVLSPETDAEPEARYRAVAGRIDKFFVPNEVIAPEQPMKVVEVIALDRHDDEPLLQPMSGIEKLKLIGDNVYRPEFVDFLDRHNPHFHQIAALSGAVYCARLYRPWDLTQIDGTLEVLRAHWKTDPAQAAIL